MVVVSISETYDLHTIVNKMSIIGVHTPKKELIQKTYPGLCMNYKYFRIKSVDVTLSTAQMLPLSVDQIGLNTGQIRPQDMMNPILYKAVSNDSWSTLDARIMGLISSTPGNNALRGDMARVENDDVTGLADEHGVYYSLLSHRDGFKVAHPQTGLRMKGLVPLVFDKWYTHGENIGYTVDTGRAIKENADSTGITITSLGSGGLRGRPHPMPRINTTYITGLGGSDEVRGTNWQANGMDAGTPVNTQIEMPDLPPVMLGAIILPPVTATTGILYYRMVCRAYIEFTDVRPIQEISSFANLNQFYADSVYHSDYDEQAKSMDATTDLVDVKNAEIEKVMEGK